MLVPGTCWQCFFPAMNAERVDGRRRWVCPQCGWTMEDSPSLVPEVVPAKRRTRRMITAGELPDFLEYLDGVRHEG